MSAGSAPLRAPEMAVRLGAAAARVAPAIARAAERVGEDFRTLLNTARLESGFDPSARARTSSATGLFQFLESTWLELLARHGPKHGIGPAPRAAALALRHDPEVASLMAAEFLAENRRHLEAALGRAASAADLYLAHFLGAGGAVRFLAAMAADPGRAAADLFPRAAAANRPIFFSAGVPRSLAEVHGLFARRLGAEGGTGVPHAGAGGTGTPPAADGAPRAPALAQALAARLGLAALAAATVSPARDDGATGDADGLVGLALGLAGPAGPAEAGPLAAGAARAAYLLLASLGR